MVENRRDHTVNEHLYSIILPPVTQALPLCTRTVNLLAPLLSEGLGAAAIGGQSSLAELIGPTLITLTKALGKVDPLAANQLMMDSVKISHLCFESKPVSGDLDFERHFSEYRQDVYLVMAWALWECVKDFFPSLEGSPLQGLKAAASTAWRSRMAGATTIGSGDLAGQESAPGVSSRDSD
jgi:hypothetical protein